MAWCFMPLKCCFPIFNSYVAFFWALNINPFFSILPFQYLLFNVNLVKFTLKNKNLVKLFVLHMEVESNFFVRFSCTISYIDHQFFDMWQIIFRCLDSSYTSCLQEILTMKSGAVQNSPPDKPQQEPGPWSPVGSFFSI